MKTSNAIDLYLEQIKKQSIICFPPRSSFVPCMMNCMTILTSIQTDCFYSLAPSDEFINLIRDDCYAYLEEHPDCSLENLIELFGEPETIAKDYLRSSKAIEPKKIAKTKQKKKVIIVILALGVIAALITAGIYIYDSYQISQGYNTDVIIIEE